MNISIIQAKKAYQVIALLAVLALVFGPFNQAFAVDDGPAPILGCPQDYTGTYPDCVPPAPTPIPGCMDVEANNFNPEANAPVNESCTYDPVYCTDIEAINYEEEGQCQYEPLPIYGCEIEGHKYDKEGNPLAGWTIGLEKIASDGENTEVYDILSDVTDKDGYYCLEWGDGPEFTLRSEDTIEGEYTSFVYRVFEVLQTGWSYFGIEKGTKEQNESNTLTEAEDVEIDGDYVSTQVFDANGVIPAEAEYHVDFYNEEDEGPMCLDETEGSWVDDVVDSEQGGRADESPVLEARSNTGDTVDVADWVPETNDGTGFFSLGFGGWIVVSFDSYVPDVVGTDLTIYEATNGEYPEETASVEVSQNGSDWYFAGTADNTNTPSRTTEIDFSGTGLAWIKFVRVTDTSDTENFVNYPDADGFDLDAIEVTEQVCDEPVVVIDPCEEDSDYETPIVKPRVSILDIQIPEDDCDNGEEALSCELTVDEEAENVEDTITLKWTTVDADSASLTQFGAIDGEGLPNGSAVVNTTGEEETFTLTVYNNEDEESAECSVTVNQSSGGSSSSSSSRHGTKKSSNNEPEGQVLGEATSAMPVGAPNTGAGGTSPIAPTLPTLFAILGEATTMRRGK